MRCATSRLVLFLVATVLATGVLAAEPGGQPTVPAPPPPPPAENQAPAAPDAPSNGLEPEITITGKGTEIHEEYRYNGRLYRVKVIPRYGPPYYLDYDEHGNFHRSDAEPKVLVPQWVIKRF